MKSQNASLKYSHGLIKNLHIVMIIYHISYSKMYIKNI